MPWDTDPHVDKITVPYPADPHITHHPDATYIACGQTYLARQYAGSPIQECINSPSAEL